PDSVAKPMRKVAPGNISSREYQPSSGESMASLANPSLPLKTSDRAELRKIETMMKSKRTGAVIAAMMNSGSVRPREMRARKRPTKAPQASQNAQKNSVHEAIRSEPSLA